jgi:hypothetical protein
MSCDFVLAPLVTRFSQSRDVNPMTQAVLHSNIITPHTSSQSIKIDKIFPQLSKCGRLNQRVKIAINQSFYWIALVAWTLMSAPFNLLCDFNNPTPCVTITNPVLNSLIHYQQKPTIPAIV